MSFESYPAPVPASVPVQAPAPVPVHVVPVDPPVAAAARCPSCAATVAPDAPWCSLCYADLRPFVEAVAPPVPVPVAEPTPAVSPVVAPVALAVADPVAPEAAVAAATLPQGRGWPCHACGDTVPLDLSACATCGAAFLPAGGLPTLKLGGEEISSPTARVAVMLVGGFAVMAACTILLFLVGALI